MTKTARIAGVEAFVKRHPLGRKTVMEYRTRPVTRLKENALRE
ncbi:MAG: hypothetical protein R6V26_03140 [Roseovarius sp.]